MPLITTSHFVSGRDSMVRKRARRERKVSGMRKVGSFFFVSVSGGPDERFLQPEA